MIKNKNQILYKTSIFFYLFFIFFAVLTPAKTASILEIKNDDFVIGNIDAPITIIEYASLSCSHCANIHQNTLPKLMDEYIKNGKVKLIFRDFPLNYPALLGSMILQCVDSDIRYEYLSAVFLLQSDWVKPEAEIVKKELYKIMQLGGMSKNK